MTQSPVRERASQKFTNAEAALRAATGQYPTDFLIGPGGNLSRATDYAWSEGGLRAALEQAGFGDHPHDVVCVWVAQ